VLQRFRQTLLRERIYRRPWGAAMTNNEPATRKRPQGGTQYDVVNNKAEPLSCVLNAEPRKYRHNKTRDVLVSVIKKRLPLDQVDIEREVGRIVTEHQGGQNSVKSVIGDIIWMKGGTEKVVIDCIVLVKCANTYMEYPHLSHIKEDASAIEGEKRKRNHYGKVNRSTNGEMYEIPANSFIPFLVESTGRLGLAAFSFLNMVRGTQTYRRSNFISEIALLCARTIGKQIVASRDRFASESPI
jgi:hypothetical protein